jgi:putative hemolysin
MLRDHLLRPLLAAGLALATLATFASPSSAAGATPVTSPQASPAAMDAAAYCTKAGGIVRERTPVLGTNNPSTQIQLGGARAFCEFTHGEGSDDDSWIAIDLNSLVSPEPTLAVLAYLTKPPVPKSTGGANPASLYCQHLGGAEIGATNAVGGGWVTTDTDTPIDVLEACVFGDGSIIDSWGITYHANDIVRGADLTGKFVYQSANPPHVFPEK